MPSFSFSCVRRTLCAVSLALPGSVLAHSYPTGQMTILHPWTDPVPAGTPSAVLALRIVEIATDDCLLGADTAVAARIEVVSPRKPDESDPGCAIPLRAGQDLALSAASTHLLMHEINTDLRFGAEYPLRLHFAKAGIVDADLVISAPE